MELKNNKPFGDLFKRFRLKAEFATLSEFGKALADEGLLYEDSIFSRWQKGNRAPKDRKLLFTLVKIFVERGSITSFREINEFLASVGQGYLTDSEIESLPRKFLSNSPFQVPTEIAHFTGRENYIERIKQEFLNGGVVLIHGPAGIGKTALAIKIGHLLRHDFPGGVLWYRLDTSNVMNILSGVARTFGENVNDVKDVEIRASAVRSILSSKRPLLILDNAELDNKVHLLLPNSSMCSVLITSRYKNLEIPTFCTPVLLNAFTQEESISIFKKILGEKYTKRNKSKLLEIASILGNLPLAVNIFAKQILQSSKNIRVLLTHLQQVKMDLRTLRYENRNFYTSVDVSFRALREREKNIFVSLCIFAGKDFSKEAVSSINNLGTKETEEILENLVNWSLLEKSMNGRYRLHLLVKLFAQRKLGNSKLYIRAACYYEKFLEKGGRGNSKFYPNIEIELDNILFIFNKCQELKYWKANIKLWEHIGIFLWDTGLWDLVDQLGQGTHKAAIERKDDYARALCCIRELSWLYYWRGNLDGAVKWAKEGLKLAKKLKDEYLMAYAKQRLGKIYQSKRQYARAETLLKHSMELFNKLKNFERLGDTLTYLGELYILTGNLRKGEKYLKEAFSLTGKINDINQNAIVLGYLGEINYIKKSYEKARDYFQKSLAIANIKWMNVGGKVWCNIGLALLEEKFGNFKEAYRLLKVAQENTLRLGIRYDISHPLMIEYKQLLGRLLPFFP